MAPLSRRRFLGADGKQAGLSYPALNGGTAQTAALGDNTQACGDKDPAHDWQSMAKHDNNGKLDGWLQTQTTADRDGQQRESQSRAAPGLFTARFPGAGDRHGSVRTEEIRDAWADTDTAPFCG